MSREKRGGHDIVAIGGSAGGLEAVQTVLGSLPDVLEASIFVVLHQHSESDAMLAGILSRHTAMPVVSPENGQRFEGSHLYVAPADRHMILYDQKVYLARGPRENRSRPAIDPLFRSAALAGGSGTVGILLSGMLDDGVSGLEAIARCGGVTIVQDPGEAAWPQLPATALELLDVDFCLRLQEIARKIPALVVSPAGTPVPIPEDIRMEVEIATDAASSIEKESKMGELASFACPECGGALWSLENDSLRRYRCHVGHAFSARSLLEEQERELERALWIALRTLEEKARMLDSLARDERRSERTLSSGTFEERASEVRQQIDAIRKTLLQGRGEPR